MTFDSGVQVGSAKFGVGIDLRQLTRDFDQAEQMARARAARIQSLLGNIQVRVRYTETGGRSRPTGGGGGGGGGGAADPGIPQNVRAQQEVTVERRWHLVERLRLPAPEARPITVRQQVTVEYEYTSGGRAGQPALGAGQQMEHRRVFYEQIPNEPPPPPGALGGRRQLALPAPRQQRGAGGPDPYEEAFGDVLHGPTLEELGGGTRRQRERDRLRGFGGAFSPSYISGRPFGAGGGGGGGGGGRRRRAAASDDEDDDNEPTGLRRVLGNLFGQPGSARGQQNIVRFAAALAGIPLGINLAAGAARQLSERLYAAAQSAIQLEQSGRNIGAVYGAARSQVATAGQGFLADPRTAGTLVEYQQAVGAVAPLASQYGVAREQVESLVTASGRLARIHGVELPQAVSVLTDVMRGNIAAGQSLGLNLTDQNGRLRSVGMSWDELTQSVGRTRAEQIVVAAYMQEAAEQLRLDELNADDLSRSLDQLSKSWDRFRSNVAQGARVPLQVVVEAATDTLNNPLPAAASALNLGVPAAIARRVGPAIGRAGAQAQQAGGAIQQALQEHGIDPATLLALVPLLGSNPVTAPIANAISTAQGVAAIAGRIAPAPTPAPAQPTTQSFAPLTYQPGVGGEGPAIPEAIVRAHALEDAQLTQVHAQQQAQIAQTRLDEIQYRSDQRRLGAAQQLADLQRTSLQLQDQAAPDVLREAELRDQMTLASRENLSLVRQRIAAEQAALPATAELEEINYRETVATQRAVVSATDRAAGRAPRYNIQDSIRDIMDIELNRRPAAELAATEQQYGVTRANRALTQFTQAQQARQAEIQGGLYDVEARLMPAQAALRESQAQYEAANRALQSADLSDTPARTQAQAVVDAARLQMSQAAASVAQIQTDFAGVPPITNNLTIAASTVVDQDLLDRLEQAVSAGTLDALMQARTAVSSRAPAGVAGAGGGRGTP